MKSMKVGRLRALGRFFKDREASLLGKLFVLAAVFYVVWPADLIPDVPVIGWLDDIGVMGLATAYLSRVLTKYRLTDAVGGDRRGDRKGGRKGISPALDA